MLKVYHYAKCSTCQGALRWLRDRGIEFTEAAIKDSPPDLDELRAMLKAKDGNARALFNTSGLEYRAQGLKDKLSAMTDAAALSLLAGNGMLVKRPFALDTARGVFLVGFREKEWADALA